MATASSEGKPNLIYVSFLRVLDDETLELADNFFFKTRKNLDANPIMAVTFWGEAIDDCYQVKGSVDVETEGPIYNDCVAWVQSANEDMKPKAATVLHVEEVYSGKERLAQLVPAQGGGLPHFGNPPLYDCYRGLLSKERTSL